MQSFRITPQFISTCQLAKNCQLPAANRQSLNYEILIKRIFFLVRDSI